MPGGDGSAQDSVRKKKAIDAYNDAHHYRAENPLAHLHEDEAPRTPRPGAAATTAPEILVLEMIVN